jgi:hypothetical protein
MGSSWSGFLPQNDIVKLQWAVLEACQTEATAKALGILLAKTATLASPDPDADADEDARQAPQIGLRQIKAK